MPLIRMVLFLDMELIFQMKLKMIIMLIMTELNISQKNMPMEHVKSLTKQIWILLIIKYN